MNDRLFVERPQRPAPIEIAIDRTISRDELRFMRLDWDLFEQEIKAGMIRDLTEHLVEKCQVFRMPSADVLRRDPVVRMQFTLHDRGTYENWLPEERRAGKAEGRKQAIESMPYGFEPDAFYE